MRADTSKSDVISWAASLEKGSEHPVGEAILAEAGNLGIKVVRTGRFFSHSWFWCARYSEWTRSDRWKLTDVEQGTAG